MNPVLRVSRFLRYFGQFCVVPDFSSLSFLGGGRLFSGAVTTSPSIGTTVEVPRRQAIILLSGAPPQFEAPLVLNYSSNASADQSN